MITLIFSIVNTMLILLILRYTVKTNRVTAKVYRMQRIGLRLSGKKDETDRPIRSVPNV